MFCGVVFKLVQKYIKYYLNLILNSNIQKKKFILLLKQKNPLQSMKRIFNLLIVKGFYPKATLSKATTSEPDSAFT